MATARTVPDIGGIESHVAEVATRLGGERAGVEVFATDRTGTLARREVRAGMALRRFRAFPRSRDYYLSPGLFGALLRDRPALLHVQGIHTLVPPLAMLAAILGRVPFVLTFHTGGSSSAFRERSRGLQFRLLAPLLRRAACLVAVSRFEAERFEAVLGLPAGSIRVIRNGGALPPAPAGTAPVPGRIVSIGRLERYKGHHRAIEALPHLVASVPEAHLRILGSGPYEAELRALADRLGVADRVEIVFVPPVEREAMATEVARASVVALLSDYEAHPVAVMEALTLERPVLVLRTSGLTELADQGWVLGIHRGSGATETADALAAQLVDPVRADVADLPTWETCTQELSEVYDSVLEVGRGSHR
ncbi:glycosyltransferase family 4 protein [Nocardioides donggukensis]|uniref:Glycosyltransferase family 4 protein n=1 Tax=Nocardioides donggukensis TaxID=2774019 RepID=A0A927PZ16_9ACTN|nr:glycosyltransferase family 4 protein [Nocardioides donggukensis]MBD8869383.1 glycosyltransferase family 4 protein [Nocardioides donggukensis]